MEWNEQNSFVDTVPVVLNRLAEFSDSKAFECMAYYLYDYPWIIDESRQIAENYISNKSSQNMNFDVISLIKPSFTATHPSVSAAGRKKLQTSPEYSRFNSITLDEPNVPWRSDLAVVALFEYFLRNCDKSQLQSNWPFIIPTILNILDDHDASLKRKGCQLAHALIDRIDRQFLKTTGILPILWDAITPCLTYLPPGTPIDLSAVVMQDSIGVLIETAKIGKAKDEDTTNDKLDEIMRDGFLNGMRYAGQNVKLAMTLLKSLDLLIDSMQVDVVRHLQALVTVFTNILSDPFGNAYKPLLIQTCKCMIHMMQYCWPRIERFKFEILRGIATAWNRIQEDGEVEKKEADHQNTELYLKKVLVVLQDITEVDLATLSTHSSLFDQPTRQ